MATTRTSRGSSITAQDRDFVETWENIATYQNAIVKIDARGEEKQEVIQGRRQFMLTTEERLITSGKVLDKNNDPFKNGAFRPIIVPDDVTIESNPNALGDDEILQMFQVGNAAWPALLETIDSVATLRRMLDLADESEGISLARYRTIEQRLIEVRGGPTQLKVNDPQLAKFLSNKPSGTGGGEDNVVQSGASNPRRTMGGRSSDYR